MPSGSGVRNMWLVGSRRLVLAGLLALLAFVGSAPGARAQAGPDEGERVMELQRYRDAVRRHFVLKQYKELLELTEKYGHLYPEDEGTEFYRTQAEIRIEEAEKKIPFARLEDRDFKIPDAPEGGGSLLEELRNHEAEARAAAESDGSLGLESAPDSQVAMGTAPIEDMRPAPPGGTVSTEPEAQAPPPRRLPDDLAPESETGAAGAAESGDGGSSPLLMILGACAAVLVIVAALLLVGLMRRGRAKAAHAEASLPAGGMEAPPAPPLFNFDEAVDQPAPLGDTFGVSEMPQPFSETATPEGAPVEFAQVSEFDEPSSPEFASPAALGETRGTDVNQEISDLLYSPGTIEDSVFDVSPKERPEAPAPLGETRTDQSAFGTPAQDNSDLVQIPDDESFNMSSASVADVDALFAEASDTNVQPTPAGSDAPKPAPAPADSAELSSIDLFGEQTGDAPPSMNAGSTAMVGMDEIDEALHPSADVSPAPPTGETRAADAPDAFIEIPFAMEDPFQNLSGKQEQETAFNTSTAEGMAAGASEAETGVDERELLQIIEEGDGGQAAGGAGDDLWSSATAGGETQAPEANVAASGTDAVIAFQEDETAVVEFEDGGTGEQPTGQSAPGVSEPEAETVTRRSSSDTGGEALADDPFDRERQRGEEAVAIEDWGKAVYHLSIAATLRPEAQDVRDELRRARKMKKEQQTG